MSKGILIWAEATRDGYLHPVTFELANKANELSKKMDNSPVMAFVMLEESKVLNYREAFELNGFDEVFYISDCDVNFYKSDLCSMLAQHMVKEINPEIVLIGATENGRDLAPRISTYMHTGLTADCTELDVTEDGKLAATRPTFGGQLMATILSKKYPQMATVRPKVFTPMVSSVRKNTKFTSISCVLNDFEQTIEILDFVKTQCSDINSLDSAEIIVAGGKGMQTKEGFALLKTLADKLGGVVGASRVAVEMGLASPECQIGQTGKTVSPKLYIACGISGALQHTIGMDKSSKIIAINTDKDAPIFKIADYGYVGDAFEIIPQLIDKL